jgi:hypothetical protein
MIAVEIGEEVTSSPMHVVLNWKTEFLERMAAQKP